MGLTFRKGSVFDSSMQTLVCPVNTKGVMGKALAKAFCNRFPEIEYPYRRDCRLGELRVGRCTSYPTFSGKRVLCFPSKKEWWNDSELDWVQAGLQDLLSRHEQLDIASLSLVPVGCGQGGLDYDTVLGMAERLFSASPFPCEWVTP